MRTRNVRKHVVAVAERSNRRSAMQLIASSLTTGLDVIVPWTLKLSTELQERCPREQAYVTDEQIVFVGRGWRVILEQRLGETQRNLLRSLREHGFWARYRCGWRWGAPGKAIKLLESLCAHWLVDRCSSPRHPEGVYKPVLYDASGIRIKA